MYFTFIKEKFCEIRDGIKNNGNFQKITDKCRFCKNDRFDNHLVINCPYLTVPPSKANIQKRLSRTRNQERKEFIRTRDFKVNPFFILEDLESINDLFKEEENEYGFKQEENLEIQVEDQSLSSKNPEDLIVDGNSNKDPVDQKDEEDQKKNQTLILKKLGTKTQLNVFGRKGTKSKTNIILTSVEEIKTDENPLIASKNTEFSNYTKNRSSKSFINIPDKGSPRDLNLVRTTSRNDTNYNATNFNLKRRTLLENVDLLDVRAMNFSIYFDKIFISKNYFTEGNIFSVLQNVNKLANEKLSLRKSRLKSRLPTKRASNSFLDSPLISKRRRAFKDNPRTPRNGESMENLSHSQSSSNLFDFTFSRQNISNNENGSMIQTDTTKDIKIIETRELRARTSIFKLIS